jgi:hypothetical protein
MEWPIAIGSALAIIGVAALFVLRPALLRLVDRLKRVGKTGADFSQTQDPNETPPPKLSFDDLMRGAVSQTVLDRERDIAGYLGSFSLRTEDEKIKVLIRALASTRIAAEFDHISRIIFGSQLRFLVELSSTPDGIKVSGAEYLFEEAKSAYPAYHADREYAQWVGFLLHFALIRQSNDSYDITQIGTDFLKHLLDTKSAYQRNG